MDGKKNRNYKWKKIQFLRLETKNRLEMWLGPY